MSIKHSIKCIKKRVEKIEGIVMNTPKTMRLLIYRIISLPGMKSEVFVHALEEKDIYVSTTSACSSKQKTISNTLIAMGVSESYCRKCDSLKFVLRQYIWKNQKKLIKAVQETVKR